MAIVILYLLSIEDKIRVTFAYTDCLSLVTLPFFILILDYKTDNSFP
jgi:hypothetical protein